MQARALSGFGVLQIEPTDMCNLRCSMCRPHAEGWDSIHGVPKGFFSLELWRHIVDTFIEDQVCFDHIIFQWLGDPLLHPALPELLQEAQRLEGKVQYLRVDSNMILLSEERARQIVEYSLLGKIPILFVASLDAFSEAVYTKVKGADQLRLVRKNIRRLLALRTQYQAPINLQVQFVVQRENAHEVEFFKDYWLSIFRCYARNEEETNGMVQWHDEIMFKRLSVDGGARGQSEADAIYVEHVLTKGIRATEINGVQICVWEHEPWQNTHAKSPESTVPKPRMACPGLWSTPVIRHDGMLMYCCADLDGQMPLGSLHTHRFKDLWLFSEARTRRQQHLQGTFLDKCSQCGGINWYALPSHSVEWS